MEYARAVYEEFQYNIDTADYRTKDWFLVWSNPIYVWVITLLYLIITFLGPRFMRNRQPYSLSGFLVVYNLALVALSVYMFVEMNLSAIDAGYSYTCEDYHEPIPGVHNEKEMRVARVMWWYFFSKVIELLDTVLMVVRKKESQITFLHWFHHASMLNIWWWVMMWIPGGNSFFGASVNCLVHIVMYLYYGLSAIPSLRGKLWWKKYITKFQLIQFCINLGHTTLALYLDCGFPPWGLNLLFGYMLIMITLFTNFYMRTYSQKAALKKVNGGRNQKQA